MLTSALILNPSNMPHHLNDRLTIHYSFLCVLSTDQSINLPFDFLGFIGAYLLKKINLLQLDRKPSKCVVFEDDPRGITAAHNCTMMAVALIGAHPAYVLLFSDFPPYC